MTSPTTSRTTADPARSRAHRRRDTLARLESDVDVWVASADAAGGNPHLVPLSFRWDGSTILVATPTTSPTGRNLKATGRVRLAFGTTRDVVIVEGTVTPVSKAEIAEDEADGFAARTGFEPRAPSTEYVYLRVEPLRIQAWREVNELEDRDLMRAGTWLDD